MMDNHEVGSSAEDDLEAILEIVSASAERRRIDTVKRLGKALNQVRDVHHGVQKSFQGGFSLSQTNYSVTGEVGRNTFFWSRTGSNDQLMSATFEAREAGDEIIIRMSGETIYHTPITSPRYGEEFRHALESRLLKKIRLAITDPNALPPEAEIFGE